MDFAFGEINWLAVLACVVAGQVLLTIWFVALFAAPWAKAYGGEGMTKQQHTKEVPPWTYGVGAACVLALSIGISLLQAGLGVDGVGDALTLACFVSVGLFVPMALPAYAFLKKWDAFVIGAGSQVALVFAVSAILAVWP